jgi:UDP-N-acetylglucosamine 4-epimerase
VIPRWIDALLAGAPCVIFGDGETSRDFVHVSDVVQANILAATSPAGPGSPVFNVASERSTTLNQLFEAVADGLEATRPSGRRPTPAYEPFRPGDIRASEADIAAIRGALGYEPTQDLRSGLAEAIAWYTRSSGSSA